MKISLNQLWESQQGLVALFDTKFQNVKAAYWIGRAAKKIISEFKQLEKAREVLLKKYDAQKGKPLAPDREEDFKKEFDELLKEEIEISIDKIKFDQLREVKFSPKELSSLDWLVEEPADKE